MRVRIPPSLRFTIENLTLTGFLRGLTFEVVRLGDTSHLTKPALQPIYSSNPFEAVRTELLR